MNLPNRLTVVRMCLVPVILLIGFLTPKSADTLAFYISSTLCAAVFIVASVTDILDGKIARRDGLVTDFGKFMDPVADKFMVIGALFVILYKFPQLELLMIATLIIVVFRELAVTSMRLVVSTGQSIVVAANNLGKLKTVLQIVAISTVFLEPVVQHVAMKTAELITNKPLAWRTDILPLTWITLGLSVILTVWSGVAYLKAYWKYLDPQK